jgi:hypothetical protein
MANGSISVPQFESYIKHLESFGGIYAIKCLWEIIEYHQSEQSPNQYQQDLIEFWESLTVKPPPSLCRTAKEELDQMLSYGNPIVIENLISLVEESYEQIKSVLSKESILQVVAKYNEVPEQRLRKEDSNEDNWIVTNDKVILNVDYIDTYMESVINLHLLPDFLVLCERILKLCGVTNKVKLLFNQDAESFDEMIRDKNRLKHICEVLIKDGLLIEKGGEYFWQGIGNSNIGSLAALAKYLEQAKIMKSYSYMSKAFRAYKLKFNLKESDQVEWNKKYHPSIGISFDLVGEIEFEDELGFILNE